MLVVVMQHQGTGIAMQSQLVKKYTKGSCPGMTGEGIFSSCVRIDSHDLMHPAWLLEPMGQMWSVSLTCLLEA